MNRSARILLAALTLLLVVVATAIAAPSERGRERMAPVAASHQPQTADDTAITAELLDRLVDRLADAGITTDADTIAALAADHGVGGAIRLLAWADASGVTTDELAAMFADGIGWGQIAKEHDLHSGIGWIMGNGGGPPDHAQGLGRAGAPGQQDR